jgi:hypothetical protein
VQAGGSRQVPQATSRVVLTPAQQRTRRRVETLIGLTAPFLDMVLALGDRISRIAEPEDYEYYPVRAGRLEGAPPSRRPEAPSGD